MRRLFFILLSVIFVACTHQSTEGQSSSNDDTKRIAELENTVKVLRDSINLLKYPADQRLITINKAVENKNFKKAKEEITSLKSLFPSSEEASKCDAISAQIVALEKAAKEEGERIKALGFKALKQSSEFTIDYNKIKISDTKTAGKYIFDSYGGGRYYYREAERGNKYVLATMTVTTDNHNPELPQLAVYQIKGGTMYLYCEMTTRFSKWEDYGTYLGNNHDFRNDFSHTGTISFKLGTEVAEDILKGPYAIVCKKRNCLSRDYDRYSNPPVSYKGSAQYPSELTVESFAKGYELVRIYNLK